MITLSKENVVDYVKSRLDFFNLDGDIKVSAIGEDTVEEDGDGFINFVYRVSDGKHHLIVKQSTLEARSKGSFTLDLHRYMGKWFEIARFDHRFEHNLVGATVEYSFLPNGDIEVVNSGYWGNFSGSFKRAKGIAKITDPTCPSKLKVCFFMRFYAEYNIMEIDEDNYSYALVGSNTSDYLWLLSRTPTLPEEAILFLLTKAKERGYNTSMLKWVKQKHENQK